MVIDDFPGLVDLFCREYVKTISPYVREKLNISDVDLFCRKIDKNYRELLEKFFNDKESFKKSVIYLGKELYRAGFSIAFVVDAINTLIYRILHYINTEKLPRELNEEFLNFMNQFPNLIAYGFILSSVPERKKSLSVESGNWVKELLRHIQTIEDIVKGKKIEIPKEKDCSLVKVLNRLDFQVACRKLHVCDELLRNHRLVHAYFALFRDYLNMEKYLPAYLVLDSIFFLVERIYESFTNLFSSLSTINLEDITDFIFQTKIGKSDVFILFINPLDLSFINKVYGFRVGDNIIKTVFEELEAYYGKGNVIKCIDGLICGMSENLPEGGIGEQKKLFERIKDKLRQNFSVLVHKPDISGFLLQIPRHARIELEKLVNLIKYALRVSKQNPSNLLVIDTSEYLASKNFTVFKSVIDYLREAFESDKVGLAIQGIHDLKTGKLFHYEILFRLIGDDGRVVPAGEVIDLIYDFRLVHLLDLAVLRKVKSNCELFKGKERIFINISPKTLKLESARKEIKETVSYLIEKGLKIGFEITEQAAIEDFEVVTGFFKDVGTELSIDDFGTGYSSFSNFINLVELLPIKFLKIDGSYVQKLEGDSGSVRKVISAINSMAHSLGIKTVAEFASSQKIVKELKSIDVDYAQGFYFSRPQLIVK